jgi:hypothetical protein
MHGSAKGEMNMIFHLTVTRVSCRQLTTDTLKEKISTADKDVKIAINKSE